MGAGGDEFDGGAFVGVTGFVFGVGVGRGVEGEESANTEAKAQKDQQNPRPDRGAFFGLRLASVDLQGFGAFGWSGGDGGCCASGGGVGCAEVLLSREAEREGDIVV